MSCSGINAIGLPHPSRTGVVGICKSARHFAGCLPAVILMLSLVFCLPMWQPSAVGAALGDDATTFTNAKAAVLPSVVYDPVTDTIEVKRPGAVVTLTDIYNALRDDSLLQKQGQAEWLLKVNLKVFEQVRLELHGRSAGGDVDWLKLKSEPSGYISVLGSNGQISIRNTKITSWDTHTGTFDTAFTDGSGRAYISIKNRSSLYKDNRMDVIDSEIAYLGFFEETAYGISWKVISEPGEPNTGVMGKGLTGTVTGSKFHHNYFAVYVYGVGDMVFRNNEFYQSYGYGFDAHTYTQRVTVENNISHDNGTHGIIFSEYCTGNIVRGNQVFNNGGHGIILHILSENNVVEDNTATGNDDGISLFESSNNVVARNVLRGNATGIRVYGRDHDSSGNVFEGNEVLESKSYGVFMYDGVTSNTFRNNSVMSNRDAGFYMKSVFANRLIGNTIRDNEYGIRFDSADTQKLSSGNQVRDNTIEGSRQSGFYSYAPPDGNLLENSRFARNLSGDVVYPRASSAGRISRVSDWLRIFLLSAILVVGVVTGVLILIRKRATVL